MKEAELLKVIGATKPLYNKITYTYMSNPIS